LVPLPTGGSVTVTTRMADRIAALARFVASDTRGQPVLVSGTGSGWHFAYGVPSATRDTFFYGPNVIRPYERATFINSLSKNIAVVTCGDSREWSSAVSDFLFDPELSAIVTADIEPWQSAGDCRIFRVVPPHKQRFSATNPSTAVHGDNVVMRSLR
jgi:hypothetical protein